MTLCMEMVMDRHDKAFRRDASQFFIAGELCRRGLIAVVTLGNCPNTDILCSNAKGTNFAHIQVKTYIPGNRTCSVGLKSEIDYGKNFFWVLGGIPLPGDETNFEYYVIPSHIMAKNMKECFNLWVETPGKNDRPHDPENSIRTVLLPPRKNPNGWSIEQYRNRRDLIEDCLNT